MPKKGGATFGYVEQFNYPLSPCYKNQAKAGWHSGGDGSCAKKAVENEISGGGFFDWLMGKEDKKKSTTSSTSGKKKKSKSSSTDGKKKKSSTKSATKKKPSKK
jgi:hypothetical protein